jgi:hypothetical protein
MTPKAEEAALRGKCDANTEHSETKQLQDPVKLNDHSSATQSEGAQQAGAVDWLVGWKHIHEAGVDVRQLFPDRKNRCGTLDVLSCFDTATCMV